MKMKMKLTSKRVLLHDDFEYLDEDDFQSYVSGSDDDLASDPDFAESGTYRYIGFSRARRAAAQIAAHKALKRAEEEQLTYLSSSAAKKRSKQFFAKKWEEYKRLEAALNSLGCGTRS